MGTLEPVIYEPEVMGSSPIQIKRFCDEDGLFCLQFIYSMYEYIHKYVYQQSDSHGQTRSKKLLFVLFMYQPYM